MTKEDRSGMIQVTLLFSYFMGKKTTIGQNKFKDHKVPYEI